MSYDFKAISLSYKNASLAIRETVALSTEQSGKLLIMLRDYLNLQEALVVSTCNRTEVYYSSDKNLGEDIVKLISIAKSDETIKSAFGNFTFYNDSAEAVNHLYRVAIGLESQVVGDLQITGQLKNAYQASADAGMAKETAHQLGTPLSSLIGWNEIFKSDPDLKDNVGVQELEKDIHRLEMITSRFSNIGSKPSLKDEDVYELVAQGVGYLQNRVSSKVNFILPKENMFITVKANTSLMDWVIENICKNAIDAMDGKGTIRFEFAELEGNKVAIDISDSGKGIPKSKFKEIFRAGFTTKQRGWGLGLTLVKRIVESYHKGKIFVLTSEPDKGTTFRIILNK